MKWPDVYQDATLQALLKEGAHQQLRHSPSPPAALCRREASLGVTRLNQFPTLGGVGSIQNEQSTPLFCGSPWIDTLGLQMNYIVDFWGQCRRATEAARCNLLATEYARNVVEITLISSIASTYFQLRQFDAQLEDFQTNGNRR